MEPIYWKTGLDDIEAFIQKVQRGKAEAVAKSAGGRKIYLVRYGEGNDLHRTSNLSSALGAGDKKYYADKTQSGYRPTVLLVGCIHGGEFEGTAALLNLIHILETGKDFAGDPYPYFEHLCEKITLLIIPCANPDGRSRIPVKSLVGRSFEELRYYNQGTWKDGTLLRISRLQKSASNQGVCWFFGCLFQ